MRSRLPRRLAKRRILSKNLLLELAQRRGRRQTELVPKQRAQLTIRGQSIGDPPGPVERLHELTTQALAQRILGKEGNELRHERGALSGLESRRQLLLHRRRAQLGQ